uniref:ATP-dependent RNA helicase TDRD9 n=1 Tax=Amphiprion ocellaris TaxID=80972 RepID=A0AAQ5XR48_AMPOC
MKKAFTAEQISDWFTSGTTFANIKLTEEVAEKKSDGPPSNETSPAEVLDKGCVENVTSDGRRSQKPEPAGRSAPPPLASYEYPILPITKNRQELISLIENNSVVIIRGATGSGKTTQLPQYILDHYNEKNTSCNIVVTQPRKIGATSIARWVAMQRKCTLGSLVGYQVGLEKMATEHTQLIYMTTGVLLQKLVSAKCLTEFSHIFIDEVHERTEEMDFLLLVLRKLLHSNSYCVKIILMSATINCRQFAEYFATIIRGRMNPAYVFEVEGAPYAIEEFYLDDLHSLFPHRLHHPDDPRITPEMYNLAISLIQSFDEMEGKDSSCKFSVLLFKKNWCMLHFNFTLNELLLFRLQVYPLHSTVTLEEQNGVFLYPVPGYRKVILSTNIAESSVTVPDVKYVIDFCLVRHLVCDQETNYQSLRLTWASKTNCNQRRGRAGRVSKGYCYRLVTKEFWRNEMPDHMIPEMLLAPLATILLKVKLLDMGDPRSLLSTALSPPKLCDIVRTVLQLKEMGALSVKSDRRGQNEDGELTFLGRVLAHLPVDLYLGKMIVLGHVFGCLNECLIIGQSDELDWGKENFIQIKRIREVAELYEDLKKRVSQFNMHVSEDSQSSDYSSTHKQRFILQVVIAGAYYPNYFVQGEIDEHLASRELNGFNPRTTVMVRNLPPYSFLYYKQLQSMFRLCGQVKAISFDSSRAYVEFYGTSQDSGVLPEVSLSFLLGQKALPMELSVYPIQQIENCAGNRHIPYMKYSRYSEVTEVNCSSLPVLSFTVLEVGHFWGFLADEASLEKKRHLTAEINMRTLDPVTVSLYPNLLCLAPYSEINGQTLYYRAKTLHMRGSTVEVFFVDFGNTAVVASSSLRELPSDLQTVNAQEFQVARLHPSAESIIHGNQWSSRARNRFITLVKGHSLIVSLYSVLYGVMRVQLLINTEKTNTSVLDILVEEGHAIKAEESCDSKVTLQHAEILDVFILLQQNHEALMSLYKDKEDGTYVPDSVSSSWKDRKKEEKEIIDSLLAHFSKGSQSYVRLHGPSSPYKINFHSLMSSCRTVCIDRTSINSFALNENPHYKHERMLVAGTVSVDSTGTCILLRDTTLMPDIPGLPALITMLFTPIMELRTNKERTCYTGALCGLGCNSQTQEAILPEHDIELAFDVKFDVEDITEVRVVVRERGSYSDVLRWTAVSHAAIATASSQKTNQELHSYFLNCAHYQNIRTSQQLHAQ